MNIISNIAQNSYVAWITIANKLDENFNTIEKNNISVHEEIVNIKNDVTNISNEYVKKDELPSFVSSEVSVDENANSININGSKYTLIASDNVLSLQQYIPTSINELTLSNIEYTKLENGSGQKYIGTSYSLNCAIDIFSTQQVLTVSVNNETGNKYKLAIHNGSSYILNGTTWRTTNGNVTCNVPVMSDVNTVTISGNTSWGSKTNKISTADTKTFTVYLTEEGKTPISSKISQQNIIATATVTGKCPIMKGNDGLHNSCNTFVKDIVYGNTSGTIDLGIFEFNSGDIPTFAVPTCINKKLHGYNAEGSFEDTGWKVNETVSVTLNGCMTEYNIYCIFDDTNNPKPNAGNSKINIKLK